MNVSRPSRTSAAVLAVWTLLGLLESSKAYVADQLQGIHRGWGPALVGNLPWWWCWALLTPLVAYLAARVRLDGHWWPLALAAHLAAASVLSVAHLAAVGVVYWHTITVPVLPYLAPLARQRVGTPLGQVEVFLNGYLIVNVMTYGAIVVAWYALRFHRAMRDRERDALALQARTATLEAQMHEARLNALRMELNPHFLYNALNAIAGLVRRQDGARAVEMLARLGTLLRLTLERDSGHEVSLGRELELLDLYLDIERTRFSDRLRVDLDVPDEMLEARVPAFVLQPLVENAIRHGIAPVPEPGRIVIAASAHGGTLAIEIADTGPGVSAEAARPQGVGLRNTRARLAQLYGASAGLRLEHGAAGGTIATLWLPFRPGSARTTPTNSEPIHAHS
jgi:two-component system, LytTR family, sensor kinase